jgi:transposase
VPVTGSGSRDSRERRLEPQITIGLLTGSGGFPLMVSAFEGNKAETTTIVSAAQAFRAAHQLTDGTVGAPG